MKLELVKILKTIKILQQQSKDIKHNNTWRHKMMKNKFSELRAKQVENTAVKELNTRITSARLVHTDTLTNYYNCKSEKFES